MLTTLRLQRTCLWLYLGSLALQFYAAGLAIFGVASFMSHALLGYGLALGALILLGLTLGARLGRRAVALASGILLLTLAQPLLAIAARPAAPWLAALHPVVALVIVGLALEIARSTRMAAGPAAPGARPASGAVA